MSRFPPPATRRALAMLGVWTATAAVGAAQGTASPAPSPQSWAIHGQATYVEQDTSGFNAPYAGPNSLTPNRGAETVDATLYLGARLWRGAEGWLDAELDQGHGLDDTLGVAGFPSSEAYKVGKNQPYLRMPRLFVRQSIGQGGGDEAVEAGANQLAGARPRDRLVITIEKFAVGDVFDTNRYAHHPRADFLNWSTIDTGTFDCAADAWGYTAGAALEWYRGPSRLALDYQWVGHPAYNRDRGPVSVLALRVHAEF